MDGLTVANETYDVFVSYSRADSRHAAEIDSVLRAKGLKSFLDRRNLAPGLIRATGGFDSRVPYQRRSTARHVRLEHRDRDRPQMARSWSILENAFEPLICCLRSYRPEVAIEGGGDSALLVWVTRLRPNRWAWLGVVR
jgi:hypothetical protein